MSSLDLDALERSWAEQAAEGHAIIVTYSELSPLIARVHKAEKLLGFAGDAIANYKSEIDVWMDDLHQAEARIVQLEEALREISERPGDVDNWLVARNALAELEKKN